MRLKISSVQEKVLTGIQVLQKQRALRVGNIDATRPGGCHFVAGALLWRVPFFGGAPPPPPHFSSASAAYVSV